MSEDAWISKALSDMKVQLVKPVFLSSILIIFISAATLVAYFLGTWRLVSFGRDYIPMAPLTAVLFILLSLLLIIQANPHNSREQRWIVLIGSFLVFIVSTISLLQVIFPQLPDINTPLFYSTEDIAGVPVGKISPVTAGVFILFSISIATGLSVNKRILELSALNAPVISLLGLIIVVGYWYQTPFLYGGAELPVALSTGLGFLIGGYALLLLRRDDTILGVSFFGESIQAKLMRTFLPAVLFSVLIEGWVFSVIISHSSMVKPVFWSGIIALGAMGFIAVIIILLSRKISSIIDTAEKERDNSVTALVEAHEELKSAYNRLTANGEKLRILADYTHDCEIWEDPRGDYVSVSPSCERITGYSLIDAEFR